MGYTNKKNPTILLIDTFFWRSTETVDEMSERGVAKSIEAVYDAAGSPESWPLALETLAECFDAAGATLLLQRPDGGLAAISSPSLAAAVRDYEDWAWEIDICAARMMQRTMLLENSCWTERDMASRREIATHPFFTDFRARHGLGPIIATWASPHPRMPVIVSVHGRLGQPSYGAGHGALLLRLVRHAEKSLALTVRLLEAEAGNVAFAEALTRLSCGAFMLDEAATVVFRNGVAERLLGGDLTLQHGRLRVTGASRDAFIAACRAALGEPAIAEEAAPAPVVAQGGAEKPLVLHVLPVGETTIAHEMFATARLLVLAVELAAGQPADPALVRDLLGLTLAEARLAALVACGQSLKEAAESLRITENTARTVLKRIYGKTGISRQTELAALLSHNWLKPGAAPALGRPAAP